MHYLTNQRANMLPLFARQVNLLNLHGHGYSQFRSALKSIKRGCWLSDNWLLIGSEMKAIQFQFSGCYRCNGIIHIGGGMINISFDFQNDSLTMVRLQTVMLLFYNKRCVCCDKCAITLEFQYDYASFLTIYSSFCICLKSYRWKTHDLLVDILLIQNSVTRGRLGDRLSATITILVLPTQERGIFLNQLHSYFAHTNCLKLRLSLKKTRAKQSETYKLLHLLLELRLNYGF